MKVLKNKEFEFASDDFLWKYLDLHKFLSFIIEKKLFFTRLDRFSDALEGLTEELIGQIATIEGQKGFLDLPGMKEKVEKEKKEIDEKTALIQTTLFANCWCINKKESISLWNLYSNPDSVAIRYNPNKLIEIVVASAKAYSHEDFKNFLYGIVEYDDIWPFNFFEGSNQSIEYTPYKKDKTYSHENEFRFTVAVPQRAAGKYESFELPLGEIENDDFKIFANPKMEEWKYKNLTKLLERFKLSEKLEKSVLKIN